MLLEFLNRIASPKVKGAIVDVNYLDQESIVTMHELMMESYSDIDIEKFKADLMGKNHVILIIEKSSDKIVGFSTLCTLKVNTGGEEAVGVFSGDTIVTRKYWGQIALQYTFLYYLCSVKLKNPGKKLYWFLISKGYKTFLLMANNFTNYYPSEKEATPTAIKDMMDQVYHSMYPERWVPEKGLIMNKSGDYALKYGIAAPDETLAAENPKVKLFLDLNPDWEQGVELACVAQMDYSIMTNYLKKKLTRMVPKHIQQRFSPLLGSPTVVEKAQAKGS